MPSPEHHITNSNPEPTKPTRLEIPEVDGNGSSSTPSPTNSVDDDEYDISEHITATPTSPRWIDEELLEESKSNCDIPQESGITTELLHDHEDLPKDELDGIPDIVETPTSPTEGSSNQGSSTFLQVERESQRKGKCSKCAERKRKGWKFHGSEKKKHGSEDSSLKSRHRHHSAESPVKDQPETPMSPRTRDLSERARNIPGSPRKSERGRSKQERLHERHLERRVQHESGHKKLAKKESELKLGKDIPIVADTDDEDSLCQSKAEHHKQHHHHHKSPRRTRSERRSSHRSRSSSVSSRRNSDQQEGDNMSFTVPNRWLSYDRLSQSSDCEHRNRSNGSMIHLEYPYKPSNNQGIYISPYFSSAYRAPGAEILIASLIMIVGVVALITSFATGMKIWLIVGGVCLGLGGMFMLLGFCWYCAMSSRKKEEVAMQVKIKKFKEMVRMERSPSNLSGVKSEAEIV